eukprot:CAMPEP_0170064050 /NCGR_PEP_ID=MMETSP0019_2-20121128/4686_1 /TAXON_ID=98059 /ORGANISM="Dinobryon sp., Strain UTEXLB2267" /LENGTH=392 /DNA_ID=CAMNT_0010270629 /DNA_START=133 /DNA_END=1311 /DNA_ORIENTATION=+
MKRKTDNGEKEPISDDLKDKDGPKISVSKEEKFNSSFKEPTKESESEVKVEEPVIDEGSTSSNDSKQENQPPNSIGSRSFVEIFKSSFIFVTDNVKLAYLEMIGEGKESVLTKKTIQQAPTFRKAKEKSDDDDDNEAEPAYTGPSAIVFVKEPKSAWENMKDRLQDSPLIKEILKRSSKIGKAAADTTIGKSAQDIGQSVKHKLEDVREFWETSQNPIVYTLSEVWDGLTSETEEGLAISGIRKIDPTFNKEQWAQEVRTKLMPDVLKSLMQGNTSTLRPWFTEGAFSKVSAEIRARKQDGIVFDANILAVDENQLILRLLEETQAPVIVAVYMVQQINCVRNRDGEIVEGGEDQIRARFYSFAFQLIYDEDDGSLNWKIVEYQFVGDIPYV